MGFFWFQGEADAKDLTKATAYESEEQTFAAAIYADTDFTNIISANINSALPAGTYPYASTVRTAKVNNDTTITDYTLIETDDLSHQSDNVHLDTPGFVTCGERFSAALP